jgi:hypothetical protein
VTCAGADRITRAIDVLSFFWMPEETLQQRARKTTSRIRSGVTEGWLFRRRARSSTTTRSRTSSSTSSCARRGFGARHRRRPGRRDGVRYAAAAALRRGARDRGAAGLPDVGGPSKTLEALVVSRNLAHDGNPVMAMCIGNMGKEENHWRRFGR